MSIIYSYPEQGVLNANDMLIGTSAEKVGGKQKNITRNFSIQQIADFVNGGTGIIDPVATDFQIAVFNQGGTKLTGSIMSQNAFPNGSEITITGNLITTGSITTPANLTATGNVSLGGGINVVNLNSRTNLYGLVGDSTGTLGSNNQILISDNAGALVWDDYAAGLTYQGVWNAATNTPTLVSGTGTNGHFYIVDVAGNTNLNSNTDWQVGDWALFSGVTGAGGFWDKIDNTSELTGSGTVNVLAMFTADKVLEDSLISQANAGLNSAVVSVNASLKVRDTVEATSLNTNLKLKGAGTGGVEVMSADGVTDGKIRLNCSVGTHGVTIQSPPHDDIATYTLILPSSVGTVGQVLTSAGSGAGAQLTWSTPTTGTVTSVNYTTDFTAFTAGPGTAITTAGVFTLNKNGGTQGQYIDGLAGAWVDLPAGDTYDLGSGASGVSNSIELKLTSGSGTDNSAITLTGGTGITVAQTGDVVTLTGSAQGVTSLATGSSDTITLTGTGAGPFTGAVTATANTTAGVALGNANLATGGQIQSAINTALSGALTFKGTFNAATGLILSGVNNTLYLYNCPGGAGTRVAISIGDLYIASTAGAFYCDSASQYALNIGDEVIATAAAAADASVKTGWSVVPSTGGLTGSGTTNFVPKFTSATGLSDSLIFDNGTNVGIGTTTPASVLHLKSTVNNATQLIFENTNNGSNIDIDFYNNVNAVQSRIRYSESSGGFDFIPNTTTGSSALFISYGGNVGINVTDPDAQLEIVNSLGGSYRLGYSGTDSYFDSENFYIRSGNGGANKVIVNSSGNVGVGLVVPLSKLHVKGGSTTTQATAAAFIANSTARFVTTSSNDYGAYIGYANATNDAVAIQSAKANGIVHPLVLNPYGANVGIGTTTPDRDLHVKGNSAITRLESTGGGQNAQIDFKVLNVSTIWSIGSNISLANTGTLEFHLSGTTRVAMTTAGNVGINVTDPDAQLEIKNSLGGSYRLGFSGTDSYFDSENFYIRSGNGNVNKLIVNTSGNVGIGTVAPAVSLDVSATDAIQVPKGDTAQRAASAFTSANGMLRYNTDDNGFEGYINNAWGAIGGSGGASIIVTGGGTGDGTATSFPLGDTPSGGAISFVDVFIDGVYQNESTYTVSGTNVTITPAPPTGTTIQTKTTTGSNSGAAVTSVNGLVGAVNLRIVPNFVTAPIAAQANNLYIFDSTTTAYTVTLPGSPSLGDSIKISNRGGLATNVLGANSNNIMGASTNLTINNATAAFEIIWAAGSQGWIIIGNV